jgi:hypothetical protein
MISLQSYELFLKYGVFLALNMQNRGKFSPLRVTSPNPSCRRGILGRNGEKHHGGLPRGWRREASKEPYTLMPSRLCVCKHSNCALTHSLSQKNLAKSVSFQNFL